jgi:superfamily II DNA or RNA helicase
MTPGFAGWKAVAERLATRGDEARFNDGQRASLAAIASRIEQNSVLIADEVGMGKTRIAVEVARAVIASGGRAVILVPPGLGFQWHDELREGGVDAPRILRSLRAYFSAWDNDQPEKREPWFDQAAVIISHAFTNWRLSDSAERWRWALVPEVFARWRSLMNGQLPWGYHGQRAGALDHRWVQRAGPSIVSTIALEEGHAGRRHLDRLLLEVEWSETLDAAEYSRDGILRKWLERVVGLGLGPFELVVIDEAHKARGSDSGLSRLLENVLLPSPAFRRLALTATPVELDVDQWRNTLGRLGLDKPALENIGEATTHYDEAVDRLRKTWRSSEEARDAYRLAAARFKNALSPYVLRRDKREDPFVKRFHELSGLPIDGYREEVEITIGTQALTRSWRHAVCAAEALSVVTRNADDPVAKRLRLTLGNGHGLAALLDQVKRDEQLDELQSGGEGGEEPAGARKSAGPQDNHGDKREQRAEWWLARIQAAFAGGDEALYAHPAIGAAVKAIETWTRDGQKVLVFGRFTRPLRALVDLLNAREMIRRIENGQAWPQAKVHGARSGAADDSEWPAVLAAHRQLGSALNIAKIDADLRRGYERERQRRERLRGSLLELLETGLFANSVPQRVATIYAAFKQASERRGDYASERHAVALVARAVLELTGEQDGGLPSAEDCAGAFIDLLEAINDTEALDDESELGTEEAGELWMRIEARLHEEYNRPQGGFARLMYGRTAPESRRMIQLAFNRQRSFPRVLVAQSMVGREGLNLHRACRIVVMLHPEWNPGVVEQQIGRVDRVGSRWESELAKACDEGKSGKMLPRILVCPVIFSGTYDEYNWKVLRERWDDLRAQLHGIVIPPRSILGAEEERRTLDEISRSAPDFSPHAAGRIS